MSKLRAHWKGIAVLLIAGSCGAVAVALSSFPGGRYCDSTIGAVGHPYWQFSDGKVHVVTCSGQSSFGSYSKTSTGWVWVNDYKAGKSGPRTNLIEVHFWGLRASQDLRPVKDFHRCWHFWMNSHGPLWGPWDK